MGEHREFALCSARPLIPWPVPIQFDAVLIRIAQIKRFAQTVIGCAVERDVGRDQSAQRIGEFGAGGIASP